MAEVNQYMFSYEEVVEALLKKQGIHEGRWGIYMKFGIQGANAAVTGGPEGGVPIAMVPVLQIGLQRVDPNKKVPGTQDASAVNPKASELLP